MAAQKPDTKHLKLRGRVWWFQLAVPLGLQAKLGTTGKPLQVVCESLNTSDLKEAQRLRTARLAVWQATFEAAKRPGALDVEAVKHASEVELRRSYDQLAANYLHVRPRLGELGAAVQIHLDNPAMAAVFDNPLGGDHAAEILRRLGVEATADHVRTLSRALLEAQQTAIAMIGSGMNPPPLPASTGLGVKLAKHLDQWLNQASVTAKEKRRRRYEVEMFAKEFTTIEAVTGAAVQGWLEKRATKHAAKTVTRTVSGLRVYWSYLRSLGLVQKDNTPFDGLTLPKEPEKGNGHDKRQPFEPADVVRILNAARAKGDTRLSHLIELGMYTGARIGELCALKVEHVDLEAGAFKIMDAKTAAGIREVPIHAQLKATVARLVAGSRDGFVVTGEAADGYGSRTNALRQRFKRLKKELGFGPQLVFHSIRKTVATMLENAKVLENTAADILGHEKPRITYGLYSGGATLAVKRKAIAKLKYPGLD